MSGANTHPDCGSDCPCWERGAREEAAHHRVRRTVRELVGYIRAVGDSDPAISPEDMAERIHRVYGRKPHLRPEDVCEKSPTGAHAEEWTIRGTLFHCSYCGVEFTFDPSIMAPAPDPSDPLDTEGHEHRTSASADRGGAMDGTCEVCRQPISRRSYGSFVGPWLLTGKDGAA